MTEPTEAQRAVVAALSAASALGMEANDAVVLSDSNRVVVRLMPCGTVARVTPMTHHASAAQEVELVRWLEQTDSPVASLDARVDPRVFVRDGFRITLWTHFESANSRVIPPGDYTNALERLHAGLRQIDLTTTHVMDRVAAAQQDIANRGVTPDLAWVPDEVSRLYPGADQDLIGECRGVVLAIIAMHRWSRDDRHPSGRESGVAFLGALRDGPPWPAIDDVTW